jgi:hypothetical protein
MGHEGLFSCSYNHTTGTLSWARSLKSLPSCPIFLRSLSCYHPIHLEVHSVILYNQNYECFPYLPRGCYVSLFLITFLNLIAITATSDGNYEVADFIRSPSLLLLSFLMARYSHVIFLSYWEIIFSVLCIVTFWYYCDDLLQVCLINTRRMEFLQMSEQ